MTVALAISSSRAAIVSSDLQLWAQNARSTDTIEVVVQLAPGLNGKNIKNLFGTARLMGDYKKLGMVSATVTPADVARFGSDSRIVAIDLDRPVVQMGAAPYSRLQQVVGADAARTAFSVDGGASASRSSIRVWLPISTSAARRASPRFPTARQRQLRSRHARGRHRRRQQQGGASLRAELHGRRPVGDPHDRQGAQRPGRGPGLLGSRGIDWVLTNQKAATSAS
jgi:hypothetical protein